MLRPDFILIGESDLRAGDMLTAIHGAVCDNDPPVRRMNFVNAELCKIAINTYLTTKISYANMIAGLCDHLPGADADVVLQGVGSDTRVGPKYLKAATGYGGPCFPRDNKALASLGRRLGVRCDLAEATDTINDLQVDRLVRAVEAHAASDAKIAVLGLAYKPETCVVDASQGLELAARLSARGHIVTVYDPRAMHWAEAMLGDRVIYASTIEQALEKASVAVIATPWPQFKTAGQGARRRPENPLTIVDPWRRLADETVGDHVLVVRMGHGMDDRSPAKVVPIRRTSG
jgi:UDPglucose 6-dehydrogenase